MDDEELAKIRNQRMAQLRKQGNPSNVGQGDSNDQDKQKAQEREAELRNTILSSVLTQSARARLSILATAKPDRAKLVENIIIQNTQMGVIRGKVDEDQLKELLEKVTMSTKRETNVKYERRRVFDDDEEEDFGDL